MTTITLRARAALLASAPLLLGVLPLSIAPAHAQGQAQAVRSAPTAMPIAPSVPDAVDTPYPGTIRIDVDATDIAHRVFRTKQVIPVAPGTETLTLLYPEWLPGHHGPDGTIDALNGLRFLVDGKPVPWTRDNVEVYAFHVAVPEGAREVTAEIVYT